MYDIKNLNIWKVSNSHNIFRCMDKVLEADVSKGKETTVMSEKCQIVFDEILTLVPTADFSEIKKRKGGKLRFPVYINEKLKSTELESLELSVRSSNCLHRAGYRTIGELVEAIESSEDLKNLRNCGAKSIDEMMEKLFCYQYSQFDVAQKIKYINKILELKQRSTNVKGGGIMPFKIVRNDITKMRVDVIVNTANEAPTFSSGVDTAVYKAAGEDELLAERKKIGWLREGNVAITQGFNLPARYIIHAVSPCYIDGTFDEEEKLRGCYKKSLQLAHERKCESIAFPLISTGSFGYPKEEGMRIAVDEINAFLLKHEMLIYLVVFDTEATRLGLNLYPDLEAYIDHNYVCDSREEEYGDRYFGSVSKSASGYGAYQLERERVEKAVKYPKHEVDECCIRSVSMSDACRALNTLESYEKDTSTYEDFLEENESALKERMQHMSDTFQQYLLYMIEEKGLTNVEVYKRAIITKQLRCLI